MSSNPTVTPLQQQVFCLNTISNVSAMFYGLSETEIEDNTITCVKALLNDPNVQAQTGAWSLAWGPSVFSLPIKKGEYKGGYQPMNTMYIAHNSSTDQYVVAIAGTSSNSTMDWLLEDFNVLRMVRWPYGKHVPLFADITAGTHYGLTQLTNLKDPTSGITAIDYLESVKANNIYVTGHSLGGTLSPCFALYLQNEMSNSPSISCLPVAGATPGNATFASYYDSLLQNTTTRIWNNFDIVPHADNPSLMEEVLNLYSPGNISVPDTKQGKEFTDAVKAGITVGKLHNLTHICASAPSFTINSGIVTQVQNNCSVDPNNYFGQALFQHIDLYGYFFNIGAFQTAAANVLNGLTGFDWSPKITPPPVKFSFFNQGSVIPGSNA